MAELRVMPGGGSRMESSSRTPPLPRRKIPESKSEQRASPRSPRQLTPRCSSEGRPARRSPREGGSPRRLFFPSETMETVVANDLNNSEPLQKVGECFNQGVAIPVGCQPLTKLHSVKIFTPVDTIAGCEPDPSASAETLVQPCSPTPSSITEASVSLSARTSPRGKGLSAMDDSKKTLQFLDRKRLQFSVQDDLLSLTLDKQKEIKKRKCTFVGGRKSKIGKPSSRDEKLLCKIPLKFSKLNKAVTKSYVAKANRCRPFRKKVNDFQGLCVKYNDGKSLEGKEIPKENSKKKRGRPFKNSLNKNTHCNHILGQNDEEVRDTRRVPSSERVIANGESSVDNELDASILSNCDVEFKAKLISKSVEAFYGKPCPNVKRTVQNKDTNTRRARKTQMTWKEKGTYNFEESLPHPTTLLQEKGMFNTLLELKQSTHVKPNHCHQKFGTAVYHNKDHDNESESLGNIHPRSVKMVKEAKSMFSRATSDKKVPSVNESIQNGEAKADNFVHEGKVICNSLLKEKKRSKLNNPCKKSIGGSIKAGKVPYTGKLDKGIIQKEDTKLKVNNILPVKFPTKSIEAFYGTVPKRTRSKPYIDWSILRKKVSVSEPKSEPEMPAIKENYSPSLRDTKPCSHVASFPTFTSMSLPSQMDKGFRSRSLSPKKKSSQKIVPLRSRSTSPKKKHANMRAPLNKRISGNPCPIFYVTSGAPVPPPPKISLPKGYTWEIERVKTESDEAADKAKKEGQLKELLLKSKSDMSFESIQNVDKKRPRRSRASPRMNYCELQEPGQHKLHSNEEALPNYLKDNSLPPGSEHLDNNCIRQIKISQTLLCPSKEALKEDIEKVAKGQDENPMFKSKLYKRLTLQEDEDELRPRIRRASQRIKCDELYEPGYEPRLLSSGEALSDQVSVNSILHGFPHSETNPVCLKTKDKVHGFPTQSLQKITIHKANKKGKPESKAKKPLFKGKTNANLTLQEDDNVLSPKKIRNCIKKNYSELLEPSSLWPAKVEDISAPVTSNILLSGSQSLDACSLSFKKIQKTLSSKRVTMKSTGNQQSLKNRKKLAQAEKVLAKRKTNKYDMKQIVALKMNEDDRRPRRSSDNPRKNYCELVEPCHSALLHSSGGTIHVPFTDDSPKSRSTIAGNNSKVKKIKGKLAGHDKGSSEKLDMDKTNSTIPVNPCMCIYLFPPVLDCSCNRFSILPLPSTTSLVSSKHLDMDSSGLFSTSPEQNQTKITPSLSSTFHVINDSSQSSSSRSAQKKQTKSSLASLSKDKDPKMKQTKISRSLDSSEIVEKKKTADHTLVSKYLDLDDYGLSSKKAKKKKTLSSSTSADLGLNDSGLGSGFKSSQKKLLKNPPLLQSKSPNLSGIAPPSPTKKQNKNPPSSPSKCFRLNGSRLSSDSTSLNQKLISLSNPTVSNGFNLDSCSLSPKKKQTRIPPPLMSTNSFLNGSGMGSCFTSPEKKETKAADLKILSPSMNGIPIPPPPAKCLKKGYAWELYLVQTESITADKKALDESQAKEAFLMSKSNENLALEENKDEQRPKRSRDSPRKNYCELEQEDEMEQILALSDLNRNPCKVVQPNQLGDKADAELSKLAINGLSHSDDEGLPPSPDGLQWNAEHTINAQGVYCYCGGPGCWYNRMVSCARCRQWFHERCLAPRPLAMPITPGDPAWLFVCSHCNSGRECLKKMELSWLELVHLIMFDLTLKTERKFHHFEIDLLPFFDSSWNNFQLKKHFTSLTTEERNKKIKEQLFYEMCFENGSESGQDRNLWGLRRSVPPPGSRYQVPEVGIVHERTVLDEVTILEPVNISAANSSVILSKLNIVYKKYRPNVNKSIKKTLKPAKPDGMPNSSHVISETKHLNGKKITANGKLIFPNDVVVKTKHITHKSTLKVPTEPIKENGLNSKADPSGQTTPSEVPRPETPELKLLPYEISKLLHKRGYPKVAMKFASVIPPKKNELQEPIQTKEVKKNKKKKINSEDMIPKNVLDCLIPKQHSYRGAHNPFRLGSTEVKRVAGNLQFQRKLNLDEQTTIRSRIRKSQYCFRIHESKKLLRKPEQDPYVPCHGPEVMAQLAGQVVNPGGEIRLIMLCQQG